MAHAVLYVAVTLPRPDKLPIRHKRASFATIAMVAAAIVATPQSADAYTIASLVGSGCHEDITTAALRATRADLATAAPLPISENDQALVDDLQFSPDDDMKDLGGATLLIGIRDNDLKGRGSSDLSQLAEVHGDPNAQQEHCLRGPNEKEPGGSQAGIDACHAFILGRVAEALDGLDASGSPDPTKLTTLTVHLSIRGQVDAPLPTFYVRIGQAMHAVQDSFTHTYRTSDEMKITVVLDWLDAVNGNLDEAVDGPAHAAELDRCDDPDDLRKHRRLLAIEASTALLHATLDPALSHDQKMENVKALLDKYVGYSPGCTFDNHWCDAPEVQYKDPAGCGCHVGKATNGFAFSLAGAMVAMLAWVRRGRRRKAIVVTTATLIGLLAVPLSERSARADDAPAPSATNEHAPPPPTVVPVKEPGPKDPSQTAWGGYAGFSASIEKAALAGTVGARLRLSRHWTFGVDGEWNPWLALNGTPIRRGVVNVYGTAVLRFPLAYEKFNLRTSVNLGTSYLLSNFYGAPSGSMGLYLGGSPLGLEWKLSRVFYLIINPLNIALPVPQLHGVPLLYPQYRTTIGLEVYAG